MPSKGGGKHKLKVKKVAALAQHHKVFRAPNPELGVLTWGVHHSLMELATVPAQPLIMDQDFSAFGKQSIHNSGYNSSNLPSKFSVKEYCPLVFRDLRERFGVDADMYLNSFCEEAAVPIVTPKKSQGALYHTHDSEYLIQTLSREDVANFHACYPAYHAYIVERHDRASETLLPHYLGMFRVTLSNKTDNYFLLMRNVQSYLPDMHQTYDLKGSDVGRDANSKEKEKVVPMFKDNDWKMQNRKVRLGAEGRAWMLDTLRTDVEFLAGNKMMDYSLLVGLRRQGVGDSELFQPGRDMFVFAEGTGRPALGVTDATGGGGEGGGPPQQDLEGAPGSTSPGTPARQVMDEIGEEAESSSPNGDGAAAEAGGGGGDGGRPQSPGSPGAGATEIYFVGLVNILTRYGVKKKAAHGLKLLSSRGEKKTGMSTVDPEQYKQRFLEFVTGIIE